MHVYIYIYIQIYVDTYVRTCMHKSMLRTRYPRGGPGWRLLEHQDETCSAGPAAALEIDSGLRVFGV